MNKFITCDIGKKETYVFVPETKHHYVISNEDFIHLNVPELNGHDIVIEDAHIRAQEENSLAQSWTIDQLRQLRSCADSMGIEILCFPQKVTPKTRKIASIGLREDLLVKSDPNDIESIAFYLQEFPEAYDALKVFDPVEYKTFEKKVSHIYVDRDALTEDSNGARNQQYGIKTDYSDAVVEWIKKYLFRLAGELDSDTREWAGIELNKKNSGLKDGLKNYTSSKLKFIYGVINTIIDPNTGKPRLRSDINKPPYWKYAKKVYFGITPYHMHAGVTASNYKYHKRKAGSSCKKSMSLESKNAVKNLDDVREIREVMKESDRHLRDFWRTARKMIVEDGLR
tara:strand:- start:138 stop:1157 length:1020 start_codon:yes stop_codon:yes gene_type:complete